MSLDHHSLAMPRLSQCQHLEQSDNSSDPFTPKRSISRYDCYVVSRLDSPQITQQLLCLTADAGRLSPAILSSAPVNWSRGARSAVSGGDPVDKLRPQTRCHRCPDMAGRSCPASEAAVTSCSRKQSARSHWGGRNLEV